MSEQNRLCKTCKILDAKTSVHVGIILVSQSKNLTLISRNLVTIYHKYCNPIGYRTYYLSGDR